MEDRLIALETRLAHYERLVDELSDELHRQSGLIERLERQITKLQEQLSDMAWQNSPQDERPPPHY